MSNLKIETTMKISEFGASAQVENAPAKAAVEEIRNANQFFDFEKQTRNSQLGVTQAVLAEQTLTQQGERFSRFAVTLANTGG